MKNSDILRTDADKAGIPLRTLQQVKDGLAQARKNKCEARMAKLMLNHGRLTAAAREYITREYAQ